MSDNIDKRSASERISDLEKVVSAIYQNLVQHKNSIESLMPLKGDMNLLKEVMKLLNKKTESIIQAATPETGITAAAVSDLVVKMNIEELRAQVTAYVANGHLVAAEEATATSYLVCEEHNKDGTIANPRIQFRLDAQDPTLSEAMKGKKVGDIVSFGDDKFDAKVLEIYDIVEPAAPDSSAALPATEESTIAAATPASAPVVPGVPLAELPAESAGTFGLQMHGQSEPVSA